MISQVVLSFGIPFALIPLVMFTSRRDIMGVLVNARLTIAAAVVVAAIISALNIFLLAQTFGLLGVAEPGPKTTGRPRGAAGVVGRRPCPYPDKDPVLDSRRVRITKGKRKTCRSGYGP